MLMEGGKSDVYSDMSKNWSDMRWAQVTSTHNLTTYK